MKALTKYRPEYPDLLPEMFMEGKTLITVCAEMMITKPTFYAWTKKYPEFKAAYEFGKVLQQSWWMERLRMWMMKEENLVGTPIIFYLKTQCGWSEYNNETKSAVEVATELAEAMGKAASKTSPAPSLKIVK